MATSHSALSPSLLPRRHSSMLLFFPPQLAFSSVLAPRSPYTALAFLNGLFSSWNPSKGCVRAIKNFPFCFITSLNIPDKAQLREGERTKGRGLGWVGWWGMGVQVKEAQEGGRRNLHISPYGSKHRCMGIYLVWSFSI